MKTYVQIFTVFLFFTFAPSLLAQAPDLNPHIVKGPNQWFNYENEAPYIFFELEIGEILDKCYILKENCGVPPMEYSVYVVKQSITEPDCWCSIYEFNYRIYVRGWYRPYEILGNAIKIRAGDTCPYNPDDWHSNCCKWGSGPLDPGAPSYNLDFFVGPVNSGSYRVVVAAVQYPDWECIPGQGYEGEGHGVITDDREVKVSLDLIDRAYWTSSYYVDVTHSDSAYGGEYIDAFGKYNIVVKVMTDKNDYGQVNDWKVGHLRPNGGTEKFIHFHRWPEGDYEPPCHYWDMCWYTFAYISDDEIIPRDLWP